MHPKRSDNQATHVALLTPPAPGAIATIQLAGPDAATFARNVFTPTKPSSIDALPTGQAILGLVHHQGQRIDHAVLTATTLSSGQTVIELHVHGGVRVAQRVILALQDQGAVLADDPIAQAVATIAGQASHVEYAAVNALAKARTRRVVRWLATQRQILPARLAELADSLNHNTDPNAVAEAVRAIADRSSQARLLIEGVTIALVGLPNAGKSTLANALANRQGSLVSDTPGTTRDWVGHPAAIDGVPVALIDSAGLGQPDNHIDQVAQTQAWAKAASADLRLIVLDRSCPIGPGQADLLHSLAAQGPAILVLNKVDLPASCDGESPITLGCPSVHVAALHGTGLDALARRILATLGLSDMDDRQPTALSTAMADHLRSAARDLATTGESLLHKLAGRVDR